MQISKAKTGEWVIVIRDLPLRITSTSWKPIKDLLRCVIRMIPGNTSAEPGTVNTCDSSGGSLLPWAICSMKSEKDANIAFREFNEMDVHTLINAPAESIAGNSWYGSCLTVSLFHGERGLVAIRNQSMFPQPLQMESVSPIIDKSLIRSSNVVPRTIMPTIPHYQLPSPRSPQIPTPAVTTHHTHRLSNSGPEVLDSFSRRRSGSVQSQLKHFARSAKITPTSSVVALVGQYAGITIEQLQDQACQIARLYQPSQDGQVWMNHTLAYSSLWNTSMIPPSVTAFSGLQPQTVMPYPVTYTRLASFANPPPQTHAYHTNPNGTVVNTSWGTIPINDSRAVLIRNIHHEATPQAIKAHFATVGEPESCEINTNSSNRRKCSALLTFRTAEEARAAVSQFHSTKFLDREIQAEVAKEDNSASGGRRTLSDASSTRSGQGPIIANGSDVDPGESGSVESSQSGRRRERRKDKGEEGVKSVADEMASVRVSK